MHGWSVLLMCICIHVTFFASSVKSTGSSYTSCRRDTFLCEPGKCIDVTWVCDDHSDCDNKKDEESCGTGTGSACQTNYFGCSNGTCIMNYLVCNRHNDCSEGEDESSCGDECYETEYTCADGQCVTGDKLHCDGKTDCKDGSDELHCDVPDECSSDYMKCSDGKCVWRGAICDGDNDCPNGEDEQGCESSTCAPEETTCLGGGCASSLLGCFMPSKETSDQSLGNQEEDQACSLGQGCIRKVVGLVTGLVVLLLIIVFSTLYWFHKKKVDGESRYFPLGRRDGRHSSREAITMDDVT